MTPSQIQDAKQKIKELTDRELQDAILLKLTQLYSQQLKTANDAKRAGDNARYLFMLFIFLTLISIFTAVWVYDQIGNIT